MAKDIKKEVNPSAQETQKANDGFSFNVKSGDMDFVFTGPKKASIGIIYDVAHRLLLEVASIAEKHALEMSVKTEVNESSEKEVVKK